MITINKQPGQRILELGGGANRNPAADVNVDLRSVEGVDFAVNFEEPNWPIGSEEFDAVLSHFSLEHLSYAKLRQALKEILRVLKPGGRVIVAVPNTEAQHQWIAKNPNGWDGKNLFDSASELLFGSQDMAQDANSHKSYWSPSIAQNLFSEAGFESIVTAAYGARDTDLSIVATKPVQRVDQSTVVGIVANGPEAGKLVEAFDPASVVVSGTWDGKLSRKEMFDKSYFNGGSRVGGYAHGSFGETFRDFFPAHDCTAQHLFARKPTSVLELGAARGYIGKRLLDAGIGYVGLEISHHCWMTRACEWVVEHDFCKVPWPVNDRIREDNPINGPAFDLAFSIATFEHVPEEFLPGVLGELKRLTARGLHGIDFGGNDDGFDKTHCTLRDFSWWREIFDRHGLQTHEIVDKELLENTLPMANGQNVRVTTEMLGALGLFSDPAGRIKINVGSHISMHHHGWMNVDVNDLVSFAAANGCFFTRHDVKQGLPWGTGVVDAIFSSHCLEHMTYAEGLTFLRECRRVIKPDGALRILVPDAALLTDNYMQGLIHRFDEIMDDETLKLTDAGKFWQLLTSGHLCCYDSQTLLKALRESGWNAQAVQFRGIAEELGNVERQRQIIRETIDVQPELSLIVSAVPRLG